MRYDFNLKQGWIKAYAVCEECNGTGEIECECCGHERECDACWGMREHDTYLITAEAQLPYTLEEAVERWYWQARKDWGGSVTLTLIYDEDSIQLAVLKAALERDFEALPLLCKLGKWTGLEPMTRELISRVRGYLRREYYQPQEYDAMLLEVGVV